MKTPITIEIFNDGGGMWSVKGSRAHMCGACAPVLYALFDIPYHKENAAIVLSNFPTEESIAMKFVERDAAARCFSIEVYAEGFAGRLIGLFPSFANYLIRRGVRPGDWFHVSVEYEVEE